MKTTLAILITGIMITAAGCGRMADSGGDMEPQSMSMAKSEPMYDEESAEMEEGKDMARGGSYVVDVPADDDPNEFVSSSAADVIDDTTKKFIRTADLRFRVKNVSHATITIEDIIAGHTGFVTYTHLSSEINYKTVEPVSEDSSLETIHFTVMNNMTMRVPNTNLKQTLEDVSKLIDYLDYRTIQAEDVYLTHLSNRMARSRLKANEARLMKAIDERGKKLKETSRAEELLLHRQARADEAMIANLRIKDRIEFSTITLNIYQREAVKRTLIENEENIDAYQPGFFSQAWDSIVFGWDILTKLILFFLKIWWLFLIGAVMYLVYRKYLRPKK